MSSRIAGLFASQPVRNAAALVQKMLQGKVWEDRGAVFAATGKASGASSEGVQAVIDGTIFNAADLGSGSDAEILIALYRKHGFGSALEKINGDFAAALYDSKENALWLGRDRFGIKPLYYAKTKELLAFGSRPSFLFTVPGVSKEIDRRFAALFAGSHYRTFDNDPEASPYRDISQLPAATALKFKDGVLTKIRYWELKADGDIPESEEKLVDRYRGLLLDAVKIRLRRAGKAAFTLSGGMDSSSVLASAVHNTGSKQPAFSTVYSDRTYDESHEICSMLDKTVEKWNAVSIGDPDVFGLVDEMVRLHDEPVATATWLSHYLLCRDASQKGFQSLFGGLGGDELNAGEYEYFFFFFADLKLAGQEEKLRQETRQWIAHHDHPIFKKSFEVMEDGLKRLADLSVPGRCLPDKKRLLRYSKALDPDFFRLEAFEPAMDRPFSSYLKNRTYQDMFRETIPCCLRAEDRQTEAFGLDHFLPFFDHRLVELMFRVPGTLKIRDGVTKHLLRQSMRGILPEETRTRVKKIGWNAPAHVWFSGGSKAKLLDLVRSKKFASRGIYDVKEVERLIEEHDRIVSSNEPRDNHMMFFWQLVNLDAWLRSIDA